MNLPDPRERRRLGYEDGESRRAALTTFDRPLVLIAGAGTGKTTTLVARILAWCLGEGWYRTAVSLREGDGPAAPPDEVARRILQGVVAITFTEAAAAEMAERTARELARVAAGRIDEVTGLDRLLLPDALLTETLAERARWLQDGLDHLTVRTIHAWCLGLLLQHPMEAGLHPALAVDAEGLELEALAAEVVEDRLAESGLDERLRRLAGRGLGPRAIAEALALVTQEGLTARDLARDPLGPTAVAAFRRGLEEAAAACRDGGARALRRVGRRAPATLEAADACLATAEGLPDIQGDGAAALEALRERLGELWSAAARRKLGAWAKGSWTKGERALLSAKRRETLPATAGTLSARLELALQLEPGPLDDARRTLQPLAVRLEDGLAARGLTTFAGLLREAARLLEEHPEVRRSVRRRIDQLLVDEVQDTDGLQCDIVRGIALDGDPERRPGLFLVGDPKQSVYGWRNADLEAYERLVAAALAAGGTVRHLHRNFRSAPAILDEVSRIVAPVMVETAGLQPPFAPLVPSEALADDPGFHDPRRTAVEHWVSWVAGPDGSPLTAADDVADLEARAVAEDLRALHDDRGVPYRSCALLLRSTGRVEVFLRALRSAEVPFAVARDRNYYRRREIIEAAALIRTVISPHDRLALLAVLRSGLVGVPDAALLPLWRADLPGLAARLPEISDDEANSLRREVEGIGARLPRDIPGIEALGAWPQALLYFLDRLSDLRRAFHSEPADRFLARLRADLLLETGEAARYLGRFRLANLERFFGQIEAAIDRRGGDAQAILRTLRRSVAESMEAEEAAPKEGAEDAVQVLTVHGAKGLEFDHLYLAQLHAPPGGGAARPAEVDPRRDGGGRYSLFGAPTPDFADFRERRARVAAAEQVRTLYVAMTRAKRRLVMIGCPRPEGRPRKRPWAEARSHLELLAHRRPSAPDLAAAWTAGEAEVASERDPGVRWRLPALDLPRQGTRAPRADRQADPAVGDGLARALDLEVERGRARAYRERPLTSAPSLTSEGTESPPGDPGDSSPAPPRVALAVGQALHRALETWRLDADVEEEASRQHGRIDRWLAAVLRGERLAEGRRRAGELLDRWQAGPLLPRLRDLGPTVAGREVPLIAPATGDAEPLVAAVGTIDLLARSPVDGHWLVIDFKTDRVDRDEAQRRARSYAAQAEAYRRAVAEGLDDPGVRAELWFLWPGVVVDPASPAAGPTGQSR